MKMSDIPLDVVKNHMNVYFDEDDYLIEYIIMPGAISHVLSHCKRTEENLEKYPDVNLAYLNLCAYLYDNRSVEVSSTEINYILNQTLGMHSNWVV